MDNAGNTEKYGNSRPQDLRAGNIRRLLGILTDHTDCTVNELSDRMGLSRTAVQNILAPLLKEGIVVEAEKRNSGTQGGKRAAAYQVRPNYKYAVFIYLSTSDIVVELSDFSNERVSYIIDDISKATYQEVLNRLRDRILEILAKRQIELKDLYGIALAVSGTVDSEQGILKSFTGYNEPEKWGRDIPLVKDLSDKLGISGEVYLDTMCNFGGYSACAALFPEMERSCLYILAHSRGIGATLIEGKNLEKGAHGLVGELGHITIDYRSTVSCRCGRTGCFEAALYPENIKKMAEDDPDLADKGLESIDDLLKLGNEKNPGALRVIEQIGELFGSLLYNVQLMTDPDTVIFHDAYGELSDELHRAIYRALGKRTGGYLHVPVDLCFYGEPFTREVRRGAVIYLRTRFLDRFPQISGKVE